MTRITESLRYISNRVHFLACLLSAISFLDILVELILVCKGKIPLYLLFITIGYTILFLSGYTLWIRKPFLREERMQNQFLDGYIAFDSSRNETEVSLTPSSKREKDKIGEILTSTKVFNLNKRQAQYLALQNQINPHFLYNTLDGIRSEALIAGVEHVAEMTETLATFFRYTISNVENLVTVEDELENCKTYFKIQQYRFGERLKLIIDCDEENQAEILRCKIPKLTLQPVLENSIIHGTELKLGQGTQTIHLMLTGSRLLITVSDDGVGMNEKKLAKLNEKLGRSVEQITSNEEDRGGIALYNVNHRIQLIFGGEYGIHIYSMENVGTDVEISMPIMMDGREIKNRGVLL